MCIFNILQNVVRSLLSAGDPTIRQVWAFRCVTIISNHLTLFLLQRIGESWVSDLYQLRELKKFDTDENFLRTLIKVKQVKEIHLVFVRYEPRHEKTCFCPMRTTKAQISL